MKITTHFEISEKARLAYDTDTGESDKLYSKVSTDGYRDDLSDTEIDIIHNFHMATVCNQFDFPQEYIRRISKEEYDRESEDGDAE